MGRYYSQKEKEEEIHELKIAINYATGENKKYLEKQLEICLKIEPDVTEASNMKTGHTLQDMNEGISNDVNFAIGKMDKEQLDRLFLFLKEKGADISTCTDELLKKFQQKEQTVDLSKDNDVKKATATIIQTSTLKSAGKAATNYDEEEKQIKKQIDEKKKEVEQLVKKQMQLKKRKREAAKAAGNAVKKAKGDDILKVKAKKLTKARMVMLATLNDVKLSEKTQPKMLKEFRDLVKNGKIKGLAVVENKK